MLTILKQAFSGQLVAQDPNNKPASELLARDRGDNPAAIPGNVEQATYLQLVRNLSQITLRQ